MADVLEYPYKAKPWIMLACMVLFGAGATFMAYTAATNDRELIVNRSLTFSVDGATTFYWGIAAIATLFVLAAAFALAAGSRNPLFIRLTSTELSAPRNGFSTKPTAIPLHDIDRVEIQSVQKHRFINVYHRQGKLSIAEAMLPGVDAFEELHSALVSRIKS